MHLTVFQAVRDHFPELARWVECTYGTQSELIFGEAVILNCDCFHQGDPLACLFFCVFSCIPSSRGLQRRSLTSC